MKEPHEPVEAFVPDIKDGELQVTWVGHSTVLLRYPATRILTDPVLTRFVACIGRVRAPARIDTDSIDICLISHAHYDHLHLPSLARLRRTTTLVVPPRCADLVAPLGFARVVELAVGETLAHRGVEITSVPAKHFGSRSALSLKRRGCCGYVVRGDGPTAYFAGDTAYFSGFADIGARFAPELAILPVGAYRPLTFRRFHMSPLDAVYAFQDLGARVLLPIHYGTFPLSYEPLEEPLAWLLELRTRFGLGDRLMILEPGETGVVRESLQSPTALGR